MKEGYIDDFDLQRVIRAVQHDMELKPIEKPEVVVEDTDSDSDEAHVVNLERKDCTCDDYEFNCESSSKETNQPRYCKHLYYVAFKKVDFL